MGITAMTAAIPAGTSSRNGARRRGARTVTA